MRTSVVSFMAAVVAVAWTCAGQAEERFVDPSFGAPPPASREPVTLRTLVREMLDVERLARTPNPRYTAWRSRSGAAVQVREGGRASPLMSRFIDREEGRREHVLAHVAGPGVIGRIWAREPAGTLRVYVDGAEDPVIEAPMEDVLGGAWLVAEPWAGDRAGALVLTLPIPFATECLVTCDEEGFAWSIDGRSYAPGTRVEGLTEERLLATMERVEWAGKLLLHTDASYPSMFMPNGRRGVIQPGETLRMTMPMGPKVIGSLAFQMKELDEMKPYRNLILRAEFDGEETIWCPMSDFMGAGIAAPKLNEFYRVFGFIKDWACFLPMPYRERAKIYLTNHGDEPVRVHMTFHFNEWHWDDESMHLHAKWKHARVPTRPESEWEMIEIEGQGLFVGQSLAVANPAEEWWGGGAVRIDVDGRSDVLVSESADEYFGFGAGRAFMAPLHSISRADGEDAGTWAGYWTISRVRSIDAVPFSRSLRVRMDVRHEASTTLGLGATVFYYARPGARDSARPQLADAIAPLPERPQP